MPTLHLCRDCAYDLQHAGGLNGLGTWCTQSKHSGPQTPESLAHTVPLSASNRLASQPEDSLLFQVYWRTPADSRVPVMPKEIRIRVLQKTLLEHSMSNEGEHSIINE